MTVHVPPPLPVGTGLARESIGNTATTHHAPRTTDEPCADAAADLDDTTYAMTPGPAADGTFSALFREMMQEKRRELAATAAADAIVKEAEARFLHVFGDDFAR